MGVKCWKCDKSFGIGEKDCPHCGWHNVFYSPRAKHTPRVEARLIAREYGLNGDPTSQINDELEARNG